MVGLTLATLQQRCARETKQSAKPNSVGKQLPKLLDKSQLDNKYLRKVVAIGDLRRSPATYSSPPKQRNFGTNHPTRTPKVHRCTFCIERHLNLQMAKEDFRGRQEAVKAELTKDAKSREALEKVVQQNKAEGRARNPPKYRCEGC